MSASYRALRYSLICCVSLATVTALALTSCSSSPAHPYDDTSTTFGPGGAGLLKAKLANASDLIRLETCYYNPGTDDAVYEDPDDKVQHTNCTTIRLSQQQIRDEIAYRLMELIEEYQRKYDSDLYSATVSADTGFQITAAALSGAAAVAGGMETPKILAAAAALVTTSNIAIDKNFLGSNASYAILDRMDSLRIAKRADIISKLSTKGIDAYPLGAVLLDIEDYARAGSVYAAVESISKDNAQRTEAANNALATATGGLGAVANSIGVKWTSHPAPLQTDLNAVTYQSSLFVAVGNSGTAYSSVDGKTWLNHSVSALNKNFNAVAWFGSKKMYVAVGDKGAVSTSLDGSLWTDRSITSGSPPDLKAILTTSTQVIVFGTGGFISTSTDPTAPAQWKKPSNLPTISRDYIAAAASDSGKLVTVSSDGFAAISTSASTDSWVEKPVNQQNLHGLTWAAGRFIAVANSGVIVSSPDAGATWPDSQTVGTQNLLAITSSGDMCIVVGSSGALLTSTDCTTWTVQKPIGSSALTGLTWSGLNFVAVGSQGTILTSP